MDNVCVRGEHYEAGQHHAALPQDGQASKTGSCQEKVVSIDLLVALPLDTLIHAVKKAYVKTHIKSTTYITICDMKCLEQNCARI